MNREVTTARRRQPRTPGYVELSRRPWHVLMFILPLVVAYEIALPLLRRHHEVPATIDIHSRRLVYTFFDYIGLSPSHLPLLLIPVIFIVWHLVRGDSWRVKPSLYGLMLLETICWTLPLLVLGLTWFAVVGLPAGEPASPTALLWAAPWGLLDASSSTTVSVNWALGATLAIGAGLYEELMFRLGCLTLVHFLAADCLKLSAGWAFTLAVGVSSVLFALYHFSPTNPFSWPAFGFYFVAGLYLGVVFALRGFGIVAMTHALYDIAYVGIAWSAAPSA